MKKIQTINHKKTIGSSKRTVGSPSPKVKESKKSFSITPNNKNSSKKKAVSGSRNKTSGKGCSGCSRSAKR